MLVVGLCAGGNASATSTGFRLQVAALIPGSALSLAQAYDADGCHGGNRSPALHWSGAPAGTRSFAVTVFDRDARHGHGWWHWATWSIPATRNGLAAGAGDRSAHSGIREARNDFGTPGYGGPCPPPGPAHHYVFRLYALSSAALDIPQFSPAPLAVRAIRAQAIATAEVILTYRRRSLAHRGRPN